MSSLSASINKMTFIGRTLFGGIINLFYDSLTVYKIDIKINRKKIRNKQFRFRSRKREACYRHYYCQRSRISRIVAYITIAKTGTQVIVPRPRRNVWAGRRVRLFPRKCVFSVMRSQQLRIENRSGCVRLAGGERKKRELHFSRERWIKLIHRMIEGNLL